jgi:hypothetical protein
VRPHRARARAPPRARSRLRARPPRSCAGAVHVGPLRRRAGGLPAPRGGRRRGFASGRGGRTSALHGQTPRLLDSRAGAATRGPARRGRIRGRLPLAPASWRGRAPHRTHQRRFGAAASSEPRFSA